MNLEEELKELKEQIAVLEVKLGKCKSWDNWELADDTK